MRDIDCFVKSHYYLRSHAVKNDSWRQVLFKWHARLPQQQQRLYKTTTKIICGGTTRQTTKAVGAQFDVKRAGTTHSHTPGLTCLHASYREKRKLNTNSCAIIILTEKKMQKQQQNGGKNCNRSTEATTTTPSTLAAATATARP